MNAFKTIVAFDFVNGAYEWILSILSALFALAYPLILGCIERVDNKYHSTRLSTRLMEENSFLWFHNLLAVNLAVSLVSIITISICIEEYQYIIMSIHLLLMLFLLLSAFCLFHTMQTYYNVEKLSKRIIKQYWVSIKKKNKLKEEKYFTQFTDLSQTLLLSAEDSIVRSVYDVLDAYLKQKYDANPIMALKLDSYFYEAISRINENLCRQVRRPVSLNSGNQILSILLYEDSIETESTYQYLWKNLRMQLFYKREDWLMSYWATASNKAMIIKYKIESFEFEEEQGDEKEKQERIAQFENFMEFHVMLCAMVMQKGMYNLLQKLLTYTTSEPPSYLLIPSKISSILTIAQRINTYDSFLFERKYPMQVMRGLTGGLTLKAVNNYLALLVYRLYVIVDGFGYDVFSLGVLPDTIAGLLSLKRTIEGIQFWINNVKQDKKVLSVLNDIKEKNGCIGSPEELLNRWIDEIDKSIHQLKKTIEYNSQKVDTMQDKIASNIRKAMKMYNDFVSGNVTSEARMYNLNSSISHFYPSTAFSGDDVAISYAGIEEGMSEGMLNNFYHLFATAFYQEMSYVKYTTSYDILFDVLDRLKVDETYCAICFGVSFDFLPQVEGLEEKDNRQYVYKGMSIVLLICPTDIFSHRMYIMKRKDLPALVFKEPTKEQVKKYDLKIQEEQYNLWLSLLRANEHSELVPERIRKKMEDDKIEESSIFTAIWCPQLYFNTAQQDITCLKINYRTYDGGTNSKLDDIKPLDK